MKEIIIGLIAIGSMTSTAFANCVDIEFDVTLNKTHAITKAVNTHVQEYYLDAQVKSVDLKQVCEIDNKGNQVVHVEYVYALENAGNRTIDMNCKADVTIHKDAYIVKSICEE